MLSLTDAADAAGETITLPKSAMGTMKCTLCNWLVLAGGGHVATRRLSQACNSFAGGDANNACPIRETSILRRIFCNASLRCSARRLAGETYSEILFSGDSLRLFLRKGEGRVSVQLRGQFECRVNPLTLILSPSTYLVNAKGAAFISSLGRRPRIRATPKPPVLKARFIPATTSMGLTANRSVESRFPRLFITR
jgi:hypothetical protein